MADEDSFTLQMELQDSYRFLVDFDREATEPLLMDEPPPLGEGAGPNAARILAAAIGNCLSASALYCLRRAHIEVSAMHTEVTGKLSRNDAGRLRVGEVAVKIEPVLADDGDEPRMRRCLEIFEDYCVVTQSVRSGVEVSVAVEPAQADAGSTER